MKASSLKAVAFGFAIAAMANSAPVFAHHSHHHHHRCHNQCNDVQNPEKINGAIFDSFIGIVDNLNDFGVAAAAIAKQGGNPDPTVNSYISDLLAAQVGDTLPPPSKSVAGYSALIDTTLVDRLGVDPQRVEEFVFELAKYFDGGVAYIISYTTQDPNQVTVFNAWLAQAAEVAKKFRRLACFTSSEEEAIDTLWPRLVTFQAQAVQPYLGLPNYLDFPFAVKTDGDSQSTVAVLADILVDRLLLQCGKVKDDSL